MAPTPAIARHTKLYQSAACLTRHARAWRVEDALCPAMTRRVMTSMRDDYVLGHSSDEYERLRRQADVLEPATRRVFESIGLQPGWSCLDVGCGPGESMRLMGEFVGPSGKVTGLDRDGKAGCEALERLRAEGQSRYYFIEANIETVDRIGGTLFDLTFARLALLFVRDPIA